ncbi:zinc finger CCHC domain-containing protein 2 [Sardina pilchardus]|uniref:zinc finger CCHC domain-containing protein 2 n=1 Tax=Sardina pilchardus TaxID=27697 RepID=UPI002E0E37BB
MLKMKLPMRAAEEGDNSVEEEQENNDCNFHAHHLISNSAPCNGTDDSGARPACPLPQLNKEAVFEWFGLHLSPAKRIEFMCGLLHMCQPFELRFLGSCLEDLARKDFYVLRDYEIKANSQTDLGLLMDVTDPVVHSKLLICLSLLGSENRECAGILFRTLSHVYSSLNLKNCGVSPSKYGDSMHGQARYPTNGGAESGKTKPSPTLDMESDISSLEQLALLFTMASLHPAFPFHQRETIRLQLDNVETAIEEYRRNCDSNETPTSNEFRKSDYLCPHTGRGRARPSHPSRTASGKAVHIEKIILKEISASSREYSFEVLWSDQSSSTVTKSHLELENFLLKLPKGHCSETCEKGLLRLLSQRDQHEPRDLERILKESFLSLPLDFRQMWAVCSFFLSDSSLQFSNHCNTSPAGKPCQSARHCNDCSETSSLEEAFSDLDLEPYGGAGAWMKRSSKGAGRGGQCCRSHQRDSRRRGRAEHNGEVEWGRQSPSRTQGHSEQCCAGEKWSSMTGKKPKARASGADRERARRGEADESFVPNGIRRPSAAQKIRQTRGPDAYGETSSESSYSTTSSPQHLQHASLQSEDEDDEDEDDYDDDRDTGSQSDTGTLRARPAKGGSGKAVALVNPMLPAALEKEPSQQAKSAEGPQSPSPVGGLPAECPLYPKPSAPLEPPLASPADARSSGAQSRQHPPVAAVSALPVSTPHLSDTAPPACTPPLPPHPSSLPLRVQHPSVPTHTPSTGPSPSPALPPSTAHSDSTSPSATHLLCSSSSASLSANPLGMTAAGAPMQMPPAGLQLGCNACGCRGSCGVGGGGGVVSGGSGGHQATTSFFLPPQQLAPRQMFSTAPPPPLPFLHLPSHLCGASYPPGAPAHQSASAPAGQQLSFYPHGPAAPPHHAHSHGPHAPAAAFSAGPLLHAHSEHLLAAAAVAASQQPGYGLPQMAAFSRFYAPVFPSVAMHAGPGGGGGGGGMKKGNNMSCYNCGLGGHYAHECKQPAADGGQAGGFRLKYVAPHSSEALDKAD